MHFRDPGAATVLYLGGVSGTTVTVTSTSGITAGLLTFLALAPGRKWVGVGGRTVGDPERKGEWLNDCQQLWTDIESHCSTQEAHTRQLVGLFRLTHAGDFRLTNE